MGTTNVTLYARWTNKPTYTVTYFPNTADTGNVPAGVANYEEGATVTVLNNTGNLVKTGYTFAGWNTLANGLGTDRPAGTTFIMPAVNVELYAKWTAGHYGINYNLNGGTGIVSAGCMDTMIQ
jgi:uncharacterized repeat protein (TIGR02543 family)